MEGIMLDSEPAERHTFVIKLWQEGKENAQKWRGRITHVASGESLHFINFKEIRKFIAQYLEDLDLSSTLISRVRRWLHYRRTRR